ncbi:MAG: hypothetical protein AAF689_17010 [Pseudomonadota bacterium]
MRDEDAKALLQEFLDQGAAAILASDADEFFKRVSFPHILITEDSEAVYHSATELRPQFFSVSRALRGNGVTDYLRIVASAVFEDENTILGDWVTHVIRHSHRLIPPYPARARIHCKDGLWKVSHAVYGIKFPPIADCFPVVADRPHLRDLNLMD